MDGSTVIDDTDVVIVASIAVDIVDKNSEGVVIFDIKDDDSDDPDDVSSWSSPPWSPWMRFL